MAQEALLPIFYFPPISWFALFIQSDLPITLEQLENFPKQTYRNRVEIYGANGRLQLSLPITHNGKRTLKEIQISYTENWRNQHWKSIKTAYQRSPYFEYYEDELEAIFQLKEKYLLDFNLSTILLVLKLLKIKKAYSLNKEYKKEIIGLDARDLFPAKSPTNFEMDSYYQTFTEKYGFLQDLSILDLLCNKGPESITYLKTIKFKSILL